MTPRPSPGCRGSDTLWNDARAFDLAHQNQTTGFDLNAWIPSWQPGGDRQIPGIEAKGIYVLTACAGSAFINHSRTMAP